LQTYDFPRNKIGLSAGEKSVSVAVFYGTAGILVAEAVVFALFGQGELQPWNGKVIAGAAPVGH
jgi:hypothetical protein